MGRRGAGMDPLSPRHLVLLPGGECGELFQGPLRPTFGLVSAPCGYLRVLLVSKLSGLGLLSECLF